MQDRRNLTGKDTRSPVATLESTLTCPHCGMAKLEIMPTDSCLFFHDCTGCGAVLRPKPGDCCVFCSYGSVPCPPKQAERNARSGAARS